MAEQSTVLYRIKDWSTFVTNRNRELKTMPWVAIPTRRDGLAYRTLVSMPGGAAHYGVFIALVTVAALCDPRGVLVRGTGEPHTPRTLAIITGMPEQTIADAMQALASPEVAWIIPTLIGPPCGNPAAIPHEGAPHARPRRDGTERNETERNGTLGADGAQAEPVEAGEEPSGKPVGAAPKRRHRIPADFAPDETRRALAVELGIDLAVEVVTFREYHAARGNTMLDWQLALATWIRNARKFAGGGPGPRSGGGASRPSKPPVAGIDRTAERLRSLDRPPAPRGPEKPK